MLFWNPRARCCGDLSVAMVLLKGWRFLNSVLGKCPVLRRLFLDVPVSSMNKCNVKCWPTWNSCLRLATTFGVYIIGSICLPSDSSVTPWYIQSRCRVRGMHASLKVLVSNSPSSTHLNNLAGSSTLVHSSVLLWKWQLYIIKHQCAG